MSDRPSLFLLLLVTALCGACEARDPNLAPSTASPLALGQAPADPASTGGGVPGGPGVPPDQALAQGAPANGGAAPEAAVHPGAAVHPDAPADPGALPANHPPMDGVAGEAAGLRWMAPSDWVSEPPASEMRLAQWRITGSAGPAECVLFHFPGGGTVQENVNRWVQQFERADGTPLQEEAEQAAIQTLQGLPLTLVRAHGTYLYQNPPMTGDIERRPAQRLIGGIVQSGEALYFVKCTGPDATLLEQESGIVSFARSFSTEPN
jgi:hypothetical protein